MICITRFRKLFEHAYPEIVFVDPGEEIPELYAKFSADWVNRWDPNLIPRDHRTIPLWGGATEVLGLPCVERRPRIDLGNPPRPRPEPYVCIATASTQQCKFWNYPKGWQMLVDYLKAAGYTVVVVQKEPTDLRGVVSHTGNEDIRAVLPEIRHCEFLVGLSSGLSWLAWALERPVVLISGYTEPFTEFQQDVVRIINTDVCHGCFNVEGHGTGDWNWCPRHKDSARMFECTRKIAPATVIAACDGLIRAANNGRGTLRLNLGCGYNRLDGYINVDRSGDPDVVWDLEAFPWPWMTDSVAEIRMSHVLEHLGQSPDVYLRIFQELYRVCRHGARLAITVPHYRHEFFFADPTHVRVVTPLGLALFSQRLNDEWIQAGAANSPLGIYAGVDFELMNTEYQATEHWFRSHPGPVNVDALVRESEVLSGLVSEMRFELVAHKPGRSKRRLS